MHSTSCYVAIMSLEICSTSLIIVILSRKGLECPSIHINPGSLYCGKTMGMIFLDSSSVNLRVIGILHQQIPRSC